MANPESLLLPQLDLGDLGMVTLIPPSWLLRLTLAEFRRRNSERKGRRKAKMEFRTARLLGQYLLGLFMH